MAGNRSPGDRGIIDTGNGDDNAACIAASFAIFRAIGKGHGGSFANAQIFKIAGRVEAVRAISGQAQAACGRAGNQAIGLAVAVGIGDQAGDTAGKWRGLIRGCCAIACNRGRVGNIICEIRGNRRTGGIRCGDGYRIGTIHGSAAINGAGNHPGGRVDAQACGQAAGSKCQRVAFRVREVAGNIKQDALAVIAVLGCDVACQGRCVIFAGHRDGQGARGLSAFVVKRGIGDFGGGGFTGFQAVKGCAGIKAVGAIGIDREAAAIGAGYSCADIGRQTIDGGD